MGATKPGSQGERAISVKTIAQGRSGRLGQTCGDCRLLFFCRRATGAASARPSLRPLFPRAHASSITSGETHRENAKPRHASGSKQDCAAAEFDMPVSRHHQCRQYYLHLLLGDSALKPQREQKARTDRSHDTSRNVATFAMPGVASASCRPLSCTRSAPELDVCGIPSTIERLRSKLQPFAEGLSQLRSARHSPFIYDKLVPNFKIPHRVCGSSACAIHPRREWRVSEPKFKP